MYQSNYNYYDAQSLNNFIECQTTTQQNSEKSTGEIIWDKSWRLLAAIGCFALAALSVWFTWYLINNDSVRSIPTITFILPFCIAYRGLVFLVKFFIHLF